MEEELVAWLGFESLCVVEVILETLGLVEITFLFVSREESDPLMTREFDLEDASVINWEVKGLGDVCGLETFWLIFDCESPVGGIFRLPEVERLELTTVSLEEDTSDVDADEVGGKLLLFGVLGASGKL